MDAKAASDNGETLVNTHAIDSETGSDIAVELDDEMDYSVGDVVSQKQPGEKARHYIVERIEVGPPRVLFIRQAKPAMWKGLLLALLLIGAWFGISALFKLIWPV